MTESLYNRLGGYDAVNAVANDLLPWNNSLISTCQFHVEFRQFIRKFIGITYKHVR